MHFVYILVSLCKFLLSSLEDYAVTCQGILGKYMLDVRYFLAVYRNAALLDGSSSLGTGGYQCGFYKKADQVDVSFLIKILMLQAQ